MIATFYSAATGSVDVEIMDAFFFTGKLKDCPDWVIEEIDAGHGTVFEGKLKLVLSTFIIYHEGDLVIRYNKNDIGAIRKRHIKGDNNAEQNDQIQSSQS